MTPTPQQAQVFARLLPEDVRIAKITGKLAWRRGAIRYIEEEEIRYIEETELLELCHRIEEMLTEEQRKSYAERLWSMVLEREFKPDYYGQLFFLANANWHERLEALEKTLT